MMTKRSIGDYLLLGLRGMGMGAADVIPGVSGGTIAFITGIYEELVHSIKSINARLLRTLFSEGIGPAWKQANGTFLATVLTGVLVSIFSLARLISWLLEHHQMLVWAFFFGLIIGSAIHVGRKITNWSAVTVIMLVAGTAIAYYITIATPATTPGTRWFVFVSGAIAISAMILPGISGSFILLLLGQYEFILNAVRDLKADILAIFGLGCVVGIIAFSNVISWLFRRYHDATLALLTGFMIGSLNKLWPWKEVVETRISSKGEVVPLLERSIWPGRFEAIYQTDPQIPAVVITALVGLGIILVFEWAGRKKEPEH
jgi:putative membrane protein